MGQQHIPVWDIYALPLGIEAPVVKRAADAITNNLASNTQMSTKVGTICIHDGCFFVSSATEHHQIQPSSIDGDHIP